MSIENLSLADRTHQPTVGPHGEVPLKNCLSPIVEARLTDVVLRLRGSWIDGPAQLWGDIHPICQMPLGEFEKRVATTLRQGFFEFSQFLAGFEVLLLQSHQLGVVSEEAVLGLEKLVVDLAHRNGDLVEVPQADSRLSNFLCRRNCGSGDADEGVVHV